CQQYNSDPFTF
nr:immunoglobulin light chain junction region [Macaca mulatta]MOV77534.1 immunoglobulin light chain junction region [Macaca mulatta]MOV77541.1 immunoglobulin light chain junction region [Macaca mulatta]MOV77687.1 immunoglobulin light chain junction region [Macaca mulatta]MOV77753.1 immunoglobulin light chain junction region [Macaca mulatta]